MESDINDLKNVNECIYKNEHYSVRDNGAVLRDARKEKARKHRSCSKLIS